MQTRITGATALALALTSAASAGTIYVADDAGSAIYEYSPSGARSVFSNQVGSTTIGAAFNSSGTLFTASRDSNSILEYSPSGVQSTFAAVSSPYGLAINAAGDVFTGENASTIMEYTPQGAGSVFGTAGGEVYSLVFDSGGNLFEGDGNGNIYEFAPNGTRTTFASGLGAAVFGLAFDPSGDLYAADWNSQIVKITPGGSKSVFASFTTNDLPTGLVYDYASGNLFLSEVADGISNPGQQSIFEFSLSGAQSTFAAGLWDPFAIADLQAIPASTPEPGSGFLLGVGIVSLAFGKTGRRRTVSRFLYPCGR